MNGQKPLENTAKYMLFDYVIFRNQVSGRRWRLYLTVKYKEGYPAGEPFWIKYSVQIINIKLAENWFKNVVCISSYNLYFYVSK